MAEITGFEPVQRVPKTHVLPLHYISIYCWSDDSFNTRLHVSASSLFDSIKYIFVFFEIESKRYSLQMLLTVLFQIVCFTSAHDNLFLTFAVEAWGSEQYFPLQTQGENAFNTRAALLSVVSLLPLPGSNDYLLRFPVIFAQHPIARAAPVPVDFRIAVPFPILTIRSRKKSASVPRPFLTALAGRYSRSLETLFSRDQRAACISKRAVWNCKTILSHNKRKLQEGKQKYYKNITKAVLLLYDNNTYYTIRLY